MAQHQRRPGEAPTGGSGFKWILIAVAVLGIGGIGYSIWNAKRGGGAATGPVSIDDLDAQSVAQPVRKGTNDAPVQIVEFADFQCPGCAHFANNVGRPIRLAYVDSGLVRIEYYDYPLHDIHPHAFLAARAARCAGEQSLYWEMHDLLYVRQQEWAAERNAPIERYVGYAQTVGANAQSFESCLRSDRFADVVTANAMLGAQLGVRSTPTIYLNGRNVGEAWSDPNAMRRLIDQALAAAPARAAADTSATTDSAAAVTTGQ